VLSKPADDCGSPASAHHAVALGLEQCQDVAVVVAELGPTWSVELHDAAPGGATIIIQPVDPDGPDDPTLFVHSVGSVFHLDELCGDQFRQLGEHREWAGLLRAVLLRLVGEIPAPPMRH
jgi:hypothetical protein